MKWALPPGVQIRAICTGVARSAGASPQPFASEDPAMYQVDQRDEVISFVTCRDPMVVRRCLQ
jgi:hypothetical protein